MSDAPGPDAREIAAALNAQAAQLGRLIFPAAKEYGGFLHIGSIEGEAGRSLKIRTKGNKIGAWADYSRDRGDPAGTGDMLKLVQLTVGRGDIKEAIRWAKGYLGLDTMDSAAIGRMRDRARLATERAERAAATEGEKKRLNAVGIWNHAARGQGSPAQSYLEGRGIDFARLGKFPGAIRYRPDVWCSELRRPVPAMVSLFVGVDAKPKAVHVTYLERGPRGWVKAKLETAKLIRSPLYWGAHIPLAKGAVGDMPLRDVPTGTMVHVAEGIEDGLTIAMVKPAERVVAAGTLGNIGAMQLPDAVAGLVIIGQHDRPGSPADQSLEKQIAAQQKLGRRVACLWPEPGFKDFNDQLRGVRKEGV
ncbi:hypothetical protein S2M10_29560 [Sphingomonas sp. S2M10]|uniref:DUF7146 domain-containing protein n=1 Tax=Sphingomonas sp. S2M10 TaxID=2705010 RepID=UPI00145743A9|nr:hypothetical protein [Sphingomonas sp. S2M10]